MAGDQCIERVRALLHECGQQHPACPSLTFPLLPSRILDLGRTYDTISPKLHISTPGEKSFYTALSYCWGRFQDIITTQANMSQHVLGIPLDTLPQTIRDAIRVTRKLGYQYLWVDALCIVQDNTKDKATEINNMGAIYKNATLTIAASNSDSVYKGFLAAPSEQKGLKLPFLLPDSTVGSLTLGKAIEDIDSVPYKGGPLATRGWALQESMLSTRVLFFGASEMKWQCPMEDLDHVMGSFVRYSRLIKNLPAGLFSPKSNVRNEKKSARDTPSRLWTEVIRDYSARKLSHPSDRLPAIAGIA